MNIGILNLQGAVSEHYNITKKAIKNMGIDADIKTIRYAEDVAKCNALIISIMTFSSRTSVALK